MNIWAQMVKSLREDVSSSSEDKLQQILEHLGSAIRETQDKLINLQQMLLDLSTSKGASHDEAEYKHNLEETLHKTQLQLKRLKQQMDTVKAADAVQRAQAAMAERRSQQASMISGLPTAVEVLKRFQD
ncbi:hypothetical protein [Marinibactrum halimedae]|uniref:hypothetical protein n=1 Tax=Marinibactrum halimedae TaxID=1444977 RepID=UPI001E5CAC3C|nr:hypothetical protein [Marinibactrum halimedae]MCD9460529.1 hypothetical protein [Marinibactrum halimedae]